ncbi:MAG TPA: Mur ligase family protein [Candidatus Paceibacterota bacterium]|nr:Mur ligase family protein [Candidatus Paceibacterota bacterium]
MQEEKSVHIIGLCGVGMSATALLLKEAGWEVTGSDAECYGPPKAILERGGLALRMPYAPSNIPAEVDRFVVGRNAKLSPDTNDEVRAAHDTGRPIQSFPQVLGELTEGRENVVVAGSYGKSTTAALIAHILRHSGVDTGYFIGAEPVSLPFPAALGTAPVFVLEGDEYPSAHDDARAKFMHLKPRDVVLTAVVHDHVNVYPTFESYQLPFRELLALVPDDGMVVTCADEPSALALAEASGKTVVAYGIDAGHFRAANIAYGPTTTFTLLRPDGGDIELSTTLLGRHNVEDIVGAAAYVLARDIVPAAALPAAVASFGGVRRRLDNIAPSSRVPVYEGFGSSYEKARAATAALKLHYPDRRLVTVFEPHTFGWRNRANLHWYDDVFAGSELVFVAPPETQGASTHDQLSHEEILGRVADSGIVARPYLHDDVPQTVDALSENDVVLVLTSGSLEGTLETLARAITERFS